MNRSVWFTLLAKLSFPLQFSHLRRDGRVFIHFLCSQLTPVVNVLFLRFPTHCSRQSPKSSLYKPKKLSLTNE